MKKTSIRQLYWFTMICHIFVILCGIVTSVIMNVNYNSFIESVGKVLGIIFLIGVDGLFVVLIVFSIKVIITLLKSLFIIFIPLLSIFFSFVLSTMTSVLMFVG